MSHSDKCRITPELVAKRGLDYGVSFVICVDNELGSQVMTIKTEDTPIADVAIFKSLSKSIFTTSVVKTDLRQE